MPKPPKDYQLPEQIYRSPDQRYLEGWGVQHAKLWRTLMLSGIVILVLLATIMKMAVAFKPQTVYVTLDGIGFHVVENVDGKITLKGPQGQVNEYRPVQMRAVIENWINGRIDYDYQNPGKIYDAFALETKELATQENEALQRDQVLVKLGLQKRKANFSGDFASMQVTAQGNGLFRVRVGGKLEWSMVDPHDPTGTARIEKHLDNYTLEFVLRDIAQDPNNVTTVTNRDGYLIVSVPTETIDL